MAPEADRVQAVPHVRALLPELSVQRVGPAGDAKDVVDKDVETAVPLSDQLEQTLHVVVDGVVAVDGDPQPSRLRHKLRRLFDRSGSAHQLRRSVGRCR